MTILPARLLRLFAFVLISLTTLLPPTLMAQTASPRSLPEQTTTTPATISSATNADSAWQAAEVEKIDRIILLCLVRLRVAPDVAKAKWNSQSPVTDAAREAVVVQDFTSKAAALQIDAGLAQGFILGQIEASKMVQSSLMAHWQKVGQAKFDPAPDLAKDVRPILDALTPQMLAALQALVPLRARAGFAQVLARERKKWARNEPSPLALDAALASLLP